MNNASKRKTASRIEKVEKNLIPKVQALSKVFVKLDRSDTGATVYASNCLRSSLVHTFSHIWV